MLAGESDVAQAGRRLCSLGPDEVLVTLGSRGALVVSPQGVEHVAALPAAVVDATGCGDTFLAAYLHRRLAGSAPAPAARFAAAAATITLERSGPFEGCESDVDARLARSRIMGA